MYTMLYAQEDNMTAADKQEKHKAKSKQANDLQAKLVGTVKDLHIEFTGKIAELQCMLARTEHNLEDHRQCLATLLAGKEAAMAKMRMQLAEADQRLALLSGEYWVCD